MAFTKFEQDIAYISKLPDAPNSANGWTPERLKQQFDKAGGDIKAFINLLVDELAMETAAQNIGISPVHGIEAASVQQALAALEENIEGISAGAVPDDSITTAKLADYAVNSTKLSQSAVQSGNLADGAVTAGKIASNAVGTDNLDLGCVSTAKIGGKAVTTEKIADGAVTTDKIAGASVTNAKLANGAVASQQIYDGSVTTAKIAASAVTGAKMNLQNNDLPWIKLTYGVHYFNKTDTLPTATAGRLIFVKR